MDKIILLTGSSGYIGSNVIPILRKKFNVRGVDKVPGPHTDYEVDLTNFEHTKEVFSIVQPTIVIHLASLIFVGESESHPSKYWNNNITSTLNLLNLMVKFKVSKIIFASSAAVYNVIKDAVKEEDAGNPASVYGKTKYYSESIIDSYGKEYGIDAVCFRIFNVCGGVRNTDEAHHLIPILVKKLKEGSKFSIFGTDYPTADGTCIRDYIHINNIISAIVSAIDNKDIPKFGIYNLGTGVGRSIYEIIEEVEKVTELKLTYTEFDRREGDPAVLIADITKTQTTFPEWSCRCSLTEIIKDEVNNFWK